MKQIMIITALVMTAWTALAIQEDGLVLYFPFDEGAGDMAGDLSGSELVGVLNGVNWSDEGLKDGCVEFDEAGDHILIDPTPILDLTEELTITVWIHPTQDQDDSSIMGRRNAGNQGGHAMQWSSQFTGSPQIETWWHKGGWNGTRNKQSISPPLNEWHYIAAVYDGTEARQYINNELDATVPVAAPLDSIDIPYRIGQGQTNLKSMMGRMDEVAIYNRALSLDDLQENMTNSGLSVSPKGKAAEIWGRLKRR
ncbi:MAG: LamG domain-containing protein [Candidatus Poribacteria bacterium]|nr:LamG domain-containing protein [Candidatus Poribacteria bacterium]